jgi:hypothetical protein
MLAESAATRPDLTVACVLRSGGDYDAEYVARLRSGVEANLPLPHRFVCLADVPVPCERLPLRRGWPGWWAKLELFEQLSGPTLYFDLDTVIVGPLTEIASYPHRFTMLEDFTQPGSLASGVMAWRGDWSRLAAGFTEAQIGNYRRAHRHGDQGWIQDRLDASPAVLQRLFPGQISSFKVGRRERAAERIVCFHGRPRPREVDWRV